MPVTEEAKRASRHRYILIGLMIILGLIIFKYARLYLSGFRVRDPT